MTKQTRTEKLEAQFTGLLNSPVNSWKPTHILVRQLKVICKEAGLRFVGNKGDVLFGEEIEI